MTQFMAERHLPGITPDELTAAAGRAKSTTQEMTQEGTEVRYLRSTFVPDEEKCYCLFEGTSKEAVEQANQRASIPYDRVVEVMHLSAEDLG